MLTCCAKNSHPYPAKKFSLTYCEVAGLTRSHVFDTWLNGQPHHDFERVGYQFGAQTLFGRPHGLDKSGTGFVLSFYGRREMQLYFEIVAWDKQHDYFKVLDAITREFER